MDLILLIHKPVTGDILFESAPIIKRDVPVI